MSPDMKRLCEAAERARDGADTTQAIVRAVLTELREVSPEFAYDNACVLTCYDLETYDGERVTRETVHALVDSILAEPTAPR